MKITRKSVLALCGMGMLCLLLSTCGLNAIGMRANDLATPYKTWSYLTDHEAPDVEANSRFGYAVDVCGNYMIVGARGYNSENGRVYILYWNGSSWDVVSQSSIFTGSGGEQFGYSVSISSNYAAIGAPYYDSVSYTDQGRVYFYAFNGTEWISDGWVTTGDADDLFGSDVDIDGSYCIIGAKGTVGYGVAYIYERNGSWSMVGGTPLTPLNTTNVSDFGVSVAISGQTAVVGASLCDVSGHLDAGTVYVFERSTVGSVHWGTDYFNENAILNEPILEDSARFGYSVDITQIPNVQGSTIIIGAPYAGGVIYFFTGSGTTWSNVAGLTPTDIVSGDYFGYSVAISGQYALAGAYRDSDLGANSGSAYSFEYKFGTWAQTVTGSKLLAHDGDAGDYFGVAVNLSSNFAIVGAGLRQNGATSNVGKVYLFQ